MKQKMELDDTMYFHCFPGLLCFTQCCKDVNIVLTPYDVLRLKNAMGMSSYDFLDKYAIILYKEKKLLPIVMLKMDEKDKTCPFVSEQGCRIYKDRPWACRMFPLEADEDGTYRFLVDEDKCLGLRVEREWKVAEWLSEQGVPEYDQMNKKFLEMTEPLKKLEPQIDNPRIQDMLFMALYNLDKFREFITNTSFLQKFDFSMSKIKKLLASDVELLMLGIDWVRFGLFGEPTLKIRKKDTSKKSNDSTKT